MDVCISHDVDGFCDFYAERIVTARKPHECCECRRAIAPGTVYERATGMYEGGFFRDATCLVCADVRKAFVCGSWLLGELWESVEDELFPRWRTEGPFECLARLSTADAREYCQKRYSEWESDQ
jgi:hypothetical protein